MKLYNIKNRYLFHSNNPTGVHTYAVYYDRKSKRYRAIGLTHIFEIDKTRKLQLKNNRIIKEKFNEFEVPSGVKNSFFSKNIKGGKINLNDSKNVKVISKRHLLKSQSDRIKAFAKRDENK